MTISLESIPDDVFFADDASPAPARVVDAISPREAEAMVLARDAEESMTDALRALKRKGARAATQVSHALEHRRTWGIAIAVGAVAVLWWALRSRRRGRPSGRAAGVARSLVREAATRAVLGAAATVGARLAEAAVPMLVDEITTRVRAPRARSPGRRALR